MCYMLYIISGLTCFLSFQKKSKRSYIEDLLYNVKFGIRKHKSLYERKLVALPVAPAIIVLIMLPLIFLVDMVIWHL